MKAESFPRSGVELGGDAIAVVLGEVRHALAFREVLADQAVGVFVGPAFPGMVRRREINVRASADNQMTDTQRAEPGHKDFERWYLGYHERGEVIAQGFI